MGTNHSADIIDIDLAGKLRHLLDQSVGHRLGVRTARRLRHAHLASVGRAVIDVLHAGLDHLGDGAFFGANLLARNLMARVVHVHERTDLKSSTQDTARL